MRFPWSPLPKFCRECGCPMERVEDAWAPRFDERTGRANRRVDDWLRCSQSPTANGYEPDHGLYGRWHDAIKIGTRRVPVPDVEPCK